MSFCAVQVYGKDCMLKSLEANFVLNTKVLYEKSVTQKVLSIQVVDIRIIYAFKLPGLLPS